MSNGLGIFNDLMWPDFQQVLGLKTSQICLLCVDLISLSLSIHNCNAPKVALALEHKNT